MFSPRVAILAVDIVYSCSRSIRLMIASNPGRSAARMRNLRSEEDGVFET